jgi:tetratricopeptide (TPR) repeat protein
MIYSEMLGNKHFLARNYENAALNFQATLNSDPVNKSARKKIIICYTQIGKIREAFENFYLLVKEDIEFIIDTDMIADDCPCAELTEKYGNVFPYQKESSDLKLMLAMLWLYCSVNQSLNFFKQILVEDPENLRVQEIISLIEIKLNSNNPLTH